MSSVISLNRVNSCHWLTLKLSKGASSKGFNELVHLGKANFESDSQDEAVLMETEKP
jgi:hypothetical protein